MAGTCTGESNGRSVLTWPQVREIRTRHSEGDGIKWLAVDYGVSRYTVRDIVRGKTWVEA